MPLTLKRCSITEVAAEAYVVSANSGLVLWGGVSQAVAQAAGADALQEACDAIGGCPVGKAVVTPGFDAARYIIHAVGPVWEGEAESGALLHSAYATALEAAAQLQVASVALPLLSAGAFGCPPTTSYRIAREAIREFPQADDMDITLVLYGENAAAVAAVDFPELADLLLGADVFAAAERVCYSAVPLGDLGVAQPRRSLLGGRRRASRRRVEEACDALEEPQALGMLCDATATFKEASLQDFLDGLDEPFSTTLLALIDARGMTDAEVYKRANLSRQHFSKIRSDVDYRPTKKTVLALAVALRLDLQQTEDLLRRAGFALSGSSKADRIVSYFIGQGNYDIFAINEALYAFDQPLLA